MGIEQIISSLSPINTNEKVDTLIQLFRDNHVKLSASTVLTIRCAIRKMSVQKYFSESYTWHIPKKETKKRKENAGAQKANVLNEIEKRKNEEKEKKKERKKMLKEEKQKKKAKKRKIQTHSEPFNAAIPSISRILETFGAKNKRKVKCKMPNPIGSGGGYQTETRKSVRVIYQPMGGMNKRY